MTLAPTTPQALPVFSTGLPFVGTIDFNRPTEWAWIGGLLFDLLVVGGLSKWIIAAGIIAARYEFGVKTQ